MWRQIAGSINWPGRRGTEAGPGGGTVDAIDLKSMAMTAIVGSTPTPGIREHPSVESARMASESAQEEETAQGESFHGGRLIARRLKAHGVSKLFTLSGGHLFSIYDGCREEGIEIVDVRHESTAAFAAEGWAKVTREPGVCALTAGPGVTNGMSAMASAQANHSPIVVLGGRAPALRWGQGSLQEIDHVPFVRPLSKLAATAGGTEEIPGLTDLRLPGGARAPWRRGVRRLPAGLRVHGGGRGSRRGAEPSQARRAPRRTRDRAGAASCSARPSGR